MSLNPEATSGNWSADYDKVALERAEEDGVSYREAGFKIVVERMSDPGHVAKLGIKKLQCLWWWNSEGFNLNGSSDTMLDLVNAIEKAEVLILLLANLVLMIFASQKRRRCFCDPKLYLPCVGTLALTMGAYFLIEVQPRYLYFAYIVMFVLAGISLYEFSCVCK